VLHVPAADDLGGGPLVLGRYSGDDRVFERLTGNHPKPRLPVAFHA